MGERSIVTALSSHWWWDLTTEEFSRLDMSRIVAVLPVGTVEQHGPHLPVRVDSAINAGIVQRAVAQMAPDFPALVLPMVPYGKSNEHIRFPGTLTVGYETLARLWIDIGESVWRAGCRRMIIFNSHGGQPQVVDIVARELRVRLGMFVVGTTWWKITPHDDLFSAGEIAHGIHGGEVETSVMLKLHHELVKMDKAEDFQPTSLEIEKAGGLMTSEGAVRYGWEAQDLHPSGAAGDAASADAARGEIVVERAAAALLQLCREVSDWPLARVTNQTRYGA
jgi:creatinine amidohydrolase